KPARRCRSVAAFGKPHGSSYLRTVGNLNETTHARKYPPAHAPALPVAASQFSSTRARKISPRSSQESHTSNSEMAHEGYAISQKQQMPRPIRSTGSSACPRKDSARSPEIEIPPAKP